MRTRLAALVVIPVLILAAGCSSDSSDTSPDPADQPTSAAPEPTGTTPSESTSTPAAPAAPDTEPAETAYRGFLTALAAGQGAKACALMTPAFVDLARRQSAAFGLISPDASCVTNIEATAQQLNNVNAYKKTKLTVVSATDTEVTLKVDFATLNDQQVVIVKTNKGWRVDTSKNLP